MDGDIDRLGVEVSLGRRDAILLLAEKLRSASKEELEEFIESSEFIPRGWGAFGLDEADLNPIEEAVSARLDELEK